MELSNLLRHIVALNEGQKIIGKTRLQKMIFLLDCCGLRSGCKYSYHYYGPFSTEIAEAADDACELGLLSFHEQRGFHSVPYGVYEVVGQVNDIPSRVGGLSAELLKHKLEIMSKYSAVELELAATLQYLRQRGSSDAKRELTQLKPAKATPERVERAERLLEDLGI